MKASEEFEKLFNDVKEKYPKLYEDGGDPKKDSGLVLFKLEDGKYTGIVELNVPGSLMVALIYQLFNLEKHPELHVKIAQGLMSKYYTEKGV
jgi:hypothetical protein